MDRARLLRVDQTELASLAAPLEDEQQRWRTEDATNQRNAIEKLRRDCEALEKAMHEACREAARSILRSRARRRAAAQRHRALTDALRKRGYDPDEPRIPKHHTGVGEWTRNTIAAADNASVRPGGPLPIPIPQGWDKPQEHKPSEHKPPERSVLTDFYDATIRKPIRDLGELIAHPEDIPNAIGSVAPGLGPVAELPLVVSEFAASIRVLGGGVVVGGAADTSVVEIVTPEGIVYLRTDLTGNLAPYGGQSINEARFVAHHKKCADKSSRLSATRLPSTLWSKYACSSCSRHGLSPLIGAGQ